VTDGQTVGHQSIANTALCIHVSARAVKTNNTSYMYIAPTQPVKTVN